MAHLAFQLSTQNVNSPDRLYIYLRRLFYEPQNIAGQASISPVHDMHTESSAFHHGCERSARSCPSSTRLSAPELCSASFHYGSSGQFRAAFCLPAKWADQRILTLQ